MNLFGLVLTKLAGEPLDQLLARRVARPLGIDPAQWRWGDFGVVDGLRINGGSGNADHHVRISTRQLLRFGLLYLHRGRWGERQVLSSAWVATATTPQVPVDLPLGGPAGIDGRGVYGCNWWVNEPGAEGRPKWPGAPLGTFAASGFNNNELLFRIYRVSSQRTWTGAPSVTVMSATAPEINRARRSVGRWSTYDRSSARV